MEFHKRPYRKRQQEIQRRPGIQGTEGVAIISVSAPPISPENPPDGAVEWRLYSPSAGEQTKGNGQLNAASIGVFARSLMAKEWARALGKKRRDPRLDAFEREAIRWRKMKDAGERR